MHYLNPSKPLVFKDKYTGIIFGMPDSKIKNSPPINYWVNNALVLTDPIEKTDSIITSGNSILEPSSRFFTVYDNKILEYGSTAPHLIIFENNEVNVLTELYSDNFQRQVFDPSTHFLPKDKLFCPLEKYSEHKSIDFIPLKNDYNKIEGYYEVLAKNLCNKHGFKLNNIRLVGKKCFMSKDISEIVFEDVFTSDRSLYGLITFKVVFLSAKFNPFITSKYFPDKCSQIAYENLQFSIVKIINVKQNYNKGSLIPLLGKYFIFPYWMIKLMIKYQNYCTMQSNCIIQTKDIW